MGVEQVCFPVSEAFALEDRRRPLVDRDAIFDGLHWVMSLERAAPLGFGTRQIEPPAIVFGAPDLFGRPSRPRTSVRNPSSRSSREPRPLVLSGA